MNRLTAALVDTPFSPNLRVEVIPQPSSDPGYTEARCPACRKLLGRWTLRDNQTVLGGSRIVEYETRCSRTSCGQYLKIVIR